MKKFLRISYIVFVVFLMTELLPKRSFALDGIEFFTGFSQSKLREKGNYRMIPLMVDFNFDIKPEKFSRIFQFQIEPFISPVYEPNPNVEVGVAGLIKVGILPKDYAIQPYFKIGVGLDYMTQRVVEESTQLNFIEYGVVGVSYALTKNTSLAIEGRFRHLSNADLGDKNLGINSTFILAGIGYRF